MSKEEQGKDIDSEKREVHKASFISRLKKVVVDNKGLIGLISDFFDLGFKVVIAAAVVYLGMYFYLTGLPVYSGYGLLCPKSDEIK